MLRQRHELIQYLFLLVFIALGMTSARNQDHPSRICQLSQASAEPITATGYFTTLSRQQLPAVVGLFVTESAEGVSSSDSAPAKFATTLISQPISCTCWLATAIKNSSFQHNRPLRI